MLKRISAMVLCSFLILTTIVSPIQAKSSNKQTQHFANVVIFAYFHDDTTNEFADQANIKKIMEHFDGTSKRSFKNYMSEISYGQFEVHNVFPQYDGTTLQPYEIKNTTSAEAKASNLDYQIINEILTNIPEVTNEVVDYDGDGYVDNLTIVLNGGMDRQINPVPSLYPHKSNYPTASPWGSHYIGTYNMLNTVRMKSDESSLIAHEFLHSLGYPDLYTADNSRTPVGVWGIMAESSKYISYPLAYLRAYFSGWIQMDTITTSTQNVTVHTQSNKDGNQAVILKSPYNNYEYFVVEMRKKGDYKDPDSYDSRILDSGIIVYRVDSTVSGLSNFGSKTAVYVFRPDGDNSKVKDAYLSQESGRTSIGSADMTATLEQGALTFSDGTNSGIVISNVSSSAGDSMTFDVTIPTASLYDVWQDTNYDGGSYSSNISMVETGGKQYVVNLNRDTNDIVSNVYDGSSWTSFAGDIAAGGVDSVKIFKDGEQLYLGYLKPDATGYYYNLSINKYDGVSSWKEIATIEKVQYYDMTVVNGTVLVSRVNESSNAASFVKLDSNGNKLVEQNYYSGLCGTPKIIVMNNKTYVSTRSSSNELSLYVVDESNNTFTPVIEKQLAKSYGLATDGKNLYIATGTDKGIQMIIYDGNTVQVKPEVAMDNYEPEIAFTQGNVYVVASSKTTDRTLGVYEYNVANNTYTLEGTSVGKSLSGYTLSSSNENLYISFEENSKVVVKKKISSNELLSLTITPPNKISYIQGEAVDTTGLVVTANYRKDTRVLNSGDYTISGFDTSVAGEREATISFGGKTNTFTYVVAKKLPILASITVDVVTNEYKIGSSLSEGDIKIVANYDNGTKKELSLSDVTITNFATTNTGDYTATVEYQGKTGTFMYKVVDNTTTPTVTLVGITVNVSKNEFEVGSSLTDGDIKVVATYSNNSQKELDLSDVVVRNFTTTSEGNYTATVEYQGKTCDFTYKVVASQGNNPSTPNMVDKVINDDKTVTVNGTFMEGTTLVVTKLKEEVLPDILPTGYQVGEIFDLKLYYAGQSIDITNTVTVKMQVPEGLNTDSLLVAQVLEDGKTRVIDSTIKLLNIVVKDKILSFETDQAGKFMLLVKDNSTPEVTPPVEETTKPVEETTKPAEEVTKEPSSTESNEDGQITQTGDSTSIWLYVGFIAVACVAIIGTIIWKKKDKK